MDAFEPFGHGPRMRRVARRLRTRPTVVAAFLVVCSFLWIAVFAEFLAGSAPVIGTLACTPQAPTQWVVLANVVPVHHACISDEVGAPQVPLARGLLPLLRDSKAAPKAQLVAPFHAAGHLLGTDADGRDVLVAIVYGTRGAMGTASLAAILLVLVGCLLGSLGGYFGGATDSVVGRLVSVSLAFPPLLLALLTQALLRTPSVTALVLSVVCTRWGEVARIVRAEVLRVQHQDYLLASRALGAGPARVLWRHVLPNVRSQAIVCAAFALSTVVLVEAACAFLGYGVQGPHASWGELMAQVRQHPHALWLLLMPALPMTLLVLCQNYVADALRDGLDPHHHEASDG